jgi:hypothetical protein
VENHKNSLKFFKNTTEAAGAVMKGTHPLLEELIIKINKIKYVYFTKSQSIDTWHEQNKRSKLAKEM